MHTTKNPASAPAAGIPTTSAQVEAAEVHAYKAGDYLVRHFNQADRDCVVLATLGHEMLFQYTMPAGRVFFGIEDMREPAPDVTRAIARSVSLRGMPKKWAAAIVAQGVGLTVDDALANLGYHDRDAASREWARLHRVPALVLSNDRREVAS